MILSRRKTHFYASVVLACTLPVVFLAGLLFRPTVPTVDESVDELFAAANFAPQEDAVISIASETLSVNGINVRVETTELSPSESSEGERFLLVQPTQVFQFSDVLVYWAAGEIAPEGVDNEAILLGQLSGTSSRYFSLPSEMQSQSGHLLFYSRGQDMAIAAVPLPQRLFP